jgi:transposase
MYIRSFSVTAGAMAFGLPIDNNAAERAMRRVAVGRKNWLFAGSPAGGERAAVLYSLIESCRLVQVEPFAYLAT